MDAVSALLTAAVVANGMLVGATLDQSIKQLPARRRIGAIAYSTYSRAADLWHGVPWYAGLGIGTALITVVAASAGLVDDDRTAQQTVALVAAVVLTLAHSAVTGRAAPANFAQRGVATDERALTQVLDRFERLQTRRAALQVVTLGVVVWALVARIGAGE